MSFLKLLSYQVVLLVILYHSCHCQTSPIAIYITEVKVNRGGTIYTFKDQMLVKVSKDVDEYYFMHEGLYEFCGRKFKSRNIEVRHAFGRLIEFSFVAADRNMIILFKFGEIKDFQLFFSLLRASVDVQNYNSAKVSKSIIFPATGGRALLSKDSRFYEKMIIRRQEVGANKSFNLVRKRPKQDAATGSETFIQEADLVFLPRTYNITGLIEGDKYGLCLKRVPNSIIILRFADARHAKLFFNTVGGDVDAGINCTTSEGWLAERLEYINAP